MSVRPLLCLALIWTVLGMAGPSPLHVISAAAATCNTDTDCRRRLAVKAGTQCIGSRLVRMDIRCQMGRCVSRRASSQNCASPGRGQCLANGRYQRTVGRCDASLGRCTTRTEREVCTKSCVCSDTILIISTGKCSPSVGCQRSVSKCTKGCACGDTPVCKGRVEPKI